LWIEIDFQRIIQFSGIEIYENYNGGSIIKVETKLMMLDDYEEIWSINENQEVYTKYRIFSPPLQSVYYSIIFRPAKVNLSDYF
jgi:hypothetical protein